MENKVYFGTQKIPQHFKSSFEKWIFTDFYKIQRFVKTADCFNAVTLVVACLNTSISSIARITVSSIALFFTFY